MNVRAQLIATGFDPAAYRSVNPDVTADPIDHFLSFGAFESRRFPIALRPDGVSPALPRAVLAALTHAFVHALDDLLITDIERFWPQAEALIAAGAKPVLVMGDSHSEQYRRTPLAGDGWVLPINLRLTGASARGLANPASRGGYGRTVTAFLARVSRLPGAEHCPVLLKFGQVDTEFVFTYRCIAAGLDTLPIDLYEAFVAETVAAYVGFLATMLPPGRRIGIAAAFPPALSDASWAEGYVNGNIATLLSDASVAELRAGLAGMKIPDLPERTRRHRLFNAALRDAIAVGLPDVVFVDDCTPFLGADGVIAPAYIARSHGSDHHMDFEHTRAPTEAVLRDLIEGAR